jgi:integrase/recombinase XerD
VLRSAYTECCGLNIDTSYSNSGMGGVFFVLDKRKGKRVKATRTEINKDKYSIDQLFELFIHLKIAEGRSKRTLYKYRNNYDCFIKYLKTQGIENDIRLITKDIVRNYIVWMLTEKVRFDGHRFKNDEEKTVGLSPVTVNTRIKTIRSFFKFLKEDGYVKSNPMKSIKDVAEDEAEINVLTVDELRRLLKAPNQRNYDDFRDYCLLITLIETMGRISEVLSLLQTDIDFESNVITIKPSISKNRKARYIPIQKRTSNLLKELIKESEEFDTDYIFLSNYGEQLTPNHFRKQLRLYAKQADIKKRVHPHLLRHTAATIFLENGGDIRHLQIIGGWSDLRMVLKYTHLSSKSLAKQQSQFSAIHDVIGKLNKNRKILR